MRPRATHIGIEGGGGLEVNQVSRTAHEGYKGGNDYEIEDASFRWKISEGVHWFTKAKENFKNIILHTSKNRYTGNRAEGEKLRAMHIELEGRLQVN